MSFFSSKRERRFWIYTALVVIAIYATLGLARQLADSLNDSGLAAGLFIAGCLLVLAAVVSQGLKTRPGGYEIAVAFGIAAAYLLVFVRMSIPTERSHLIEYGVVAIFILEALKERVSQGRRVPLPALLAILITAVIGAIDECIQGVIPSRVFDPVDMLFNTLAAIMAVGASTALSWARRLAGKNRSNGH